jgi:hypothetical protein
LLKKRRKNETKGTTHRVAGVAKIGILLKKPESFEPLEVMNSFVSVPGEPLVLLPVDQKGSSSIDIKGDVICHIFIVKLSALIIINLRKIYTII